MDLEALQGCRSVGSLTIENTEITSLTALASLETAENVVIKENKFLKSLEGLEKLSHVGGLEITSHRRLASLSALQGLEVITGDLRIKNNDKLLSLDGLERLKSAKTVEVSSNDKLLSLSGLQGLQAVTEGLLISYNDVLASLDSLESLKNSKTVNIRWNPNLLSISGLRGLQAVTDGLLIEHNYLLGSLDGLENLKSSETVSVSWNTNLISILGLRGLQAVNGDLFIQGSNVLTSLDGLESLQSSKSMEIELNKNLLSISALRGLQVVTGGLRIRNNKVLTSLDGLQSLRSVGTVDVSSNDQLLSLDGLQSLESIGELRLVRNPFIHDLTMLGNLTSLDVLYIDGTFATADHVYWTLAGLEGLTSLDTLEIHSDPGLYSLAGLDNLASVRVLSIDNIGLTSLADLKSLRSADEVNIQDCSQLSNLTGLESLTSLSKVEIFKNRGLRSLVGLEGLASVGTLKISENRVQSLVGLEGLTSVGVLDLEENYECVDDCGSCTGLKNLTGLNNLRIAEELRIVNEALLDNLTGLDSLVRVGMLEIQNNNYQISSSCNRGLGSLAGLGNLVNATRGVSIRHNKFLASLNGFESLTSAGSLTVHINNQLVDLKGLESLEHVEGELKIEGESLLHSLDGLEGLRHVGTLNLTDLQSLQSTNALRSLANAWNEVYIKRCERLRSLEGLGGLLTTGKLQVRGTRLEMLGAPFATGASVGVVGMDTYSWPSCVTPQERAALALVVDGDLALSTIPNITTWPQWRPHQRPCNRTDFGTFSCTKGHPCNFSLAGKESSYTSIFISDRFTGCGACFEDHVQGEVAEDGMVHLGYALDDEEGGLRSICRCTGEVLLGPVAQLLLRGPRQSGPTACWRGGPCAIEVDGEGLERTDRVVLMGNCSQGDPSSGFAADWSAENMFLLQNSAQWGAAPPTRYQVCWRPPCTYTTDGPTCPAPEDRYFSVGDVELLGTFFRNYTVVLGEIFEAPNIGFGVLDGDRMRLRRTCGKANEAGTDLLNASSLGALFDFGRLTEDRVRAGSHQLCWCQERAGIPCDAEWHFTAVSGDVQVLCPQGQELAEGGSGRCQECPAGRQSLNPGLQPCTDCPAGRFSSPGDGVCGACQEGTYAEGTGSSACAACPAWQSSGVEATGCFADPARLVLLALFYLSVGALCTALPCTIRRRLPVVDVSLDQKCTIITTFGSHGFSNFGRLSFPAKLSGTGHPGLDSPSEHFRVRVKDAVRLELLTLKGESINRRLDTSMGTLVVPFPHDLYHQGWPVPVAFVLPALFIAVVTLGALVLWAGMVVVGPVGAAGVVLACTAASAAFRWRPRTTPLQQRCAAFRRKLSKHPYRSCNKGPDRAISIGKLQELLAFFRDFIRDRTAYYLDSNVLRALTSESRLSYAETAGAGPVEWFVSHFWGTAFEHFCTALQKHAEMVCGKQDWTKIHYWVCFCSNNQYHIKDELGSGWAESSFYITLKSGLCRGTCMVLDDKALPLTRVWCIFELLQTIKLERTEGIFEGLLLCTSSGVLNSGNGSVEVAMALARKVAQMDLGAAQASSEDDAEMIRNQVKKEMGSYTAMNNFIRSEVRDMLMRARGSANAQFDTVLATLDENVEETAVAAV